LSERTIEDAARKVGVNEKTLRKWLKDAAFQDAYRQARQAFKERTVALLLAANAKAIDTLVACLDADRPGDRIKAAVAVLEHTHRGLEQLDVLGRLEALERKAGRRGKQS